MRDAGAWVMGWGVGTGRYLRVHDGCGGAASLHALLQQQQLKGLEALVQHALVVHAQPVGLHRETMGDRRGRAGCDRWWEMRREMRERERESCWVCATGGYRARIAGQNALVQARSAPWWCRVQ